MVQHRVFPLFTKMVDPCLGCSCLILLKSTLSAAGIPISFSSHSYQIGAATMVAQQGLPYYQIKTMACWSSNAYQLYVRTPVQSYSWSGRQVTITGTYSHGYTSGSDSSCQGALASPRIESLRLWAAVSQPRGPFSLVWGLMAVLWGLQAMGAFNCLGAGWSQWRSLHIPGTHIPLSLMQLLTRY